MRLKVFGQDGGHIEFVNADDSIDAETEGEYKQNKSIYQEAVEFPRDAQGNYYQVDVFFAYEAYLFMSAFPPSCSSKTPVRISF